jgi:hypothetical protein
LKKTKTEQRDPHEEDAYSNESNFDDESSHTERNFNILQAAPSVLGRLYCDNG